MKPEGYPLPWCDYTDTAYHTINMWLCMFQPEWRKKQAYIPMGTIIPWIDKLIEEDKLKHLRKTDDQDTSSQ